MKFSMQKMAVLTMAMLATLLCFSQQATEQGKEPYCPELPWSPTTPGHPHPQPRPSAGTLTISQENGVSLAKLVTGTGCFTPSKPFLDPPGTNLLPNIYTNAYDGNGKEMPNTLPSTPAIPYNLLDGAPIVSRIDPTSPTDDLLEILDTIEKAIEARNADLIQTKLQVGIDILEGNPVGNRLYSGFPLLHYIGPEKAKSVMAIYDRDGKVIGGNVDIHQVWYDTHIESDTAFLDPTAVLDVPWTITYTVDVLSRGNDDFSPFVMYVDDPALSKPNPPLPHVGMDQVFYNMEEGTRTIFKIKMTPGKYFNLSYTWGWRSHPPRVQVTENATKRIPPNPSGKTLVQLEEEVFGKHPSSDKEHAIAQIGDLAPAKRMWTAFHNAQAALRNHDFAAVGRANQKAREAFKDWRDRTLLPSGITPDKNSDLTLLYVNNTIYGEFRDGSRIDFPKWQTRGTTLKVTLYNADYFEHGYQNVDFGGARGWENQFKSSVESGGSGCWFTFGRVHWWMNVPGTYNGQPFLIKVPPANPKTNKLGEYKIEITYNYDPSRRLRFYQFDPMHHDVSIFSIH